MSIITNDAKKTLLTKVSDNHTSETHVNGVYIPHMLPHNATSKAKTHCIYLEC